MYRLGDVLAAFVIVLSGCANDRYAAPDSFCWKQGQRFLLGWSRSRRPVQHKNKSRAPTRLFL